MSDYASVLTKLHRNHEAKAVNVRARMLLQRRRRDVGAPR